ncbi:hypothetical protein J2S74_004296 [Evansella vedderi]|uniref:YtkA-like domain-containing protein n=1 Tax=Evansella vedderi TaxID=38282 RepID=A0ABU0A054_9BACI|nr:FixH family protein [Evansella vedderi]MDQ0256874.1 hypothetical protein [Evansella vedderi]
MKKILTALLIISISLIAACGQTEQDPQTGSNTELNLDPIEVEIIAPEEADPDTDVTIQALVTQGEEKVNDASEVTFEIWKQGQKEESEMIEGTLTDEDGVYEITYRFPEENLYFIQPHVTARGMHRMPVGEIIIGDIPDEESHHDHGDDHSHDHHHGAINENLSLQWLTPEEVQLEEEVEINISVQWKGAPWVNGEVTYEIWQEHDQVHQWLDAEEIEEGVYSLKHTFDQQGEFYIIIHIEDEEIHEHILKTVHVHEH